MSTLPSPRLTGVIPPVCTPFTADLEIDVASLERLVDHLLAGGVHGLFVLGTTSEVAYLRDVHRARVLDVVVERVGGAVPVLAGVIDMTTMRMLDHAEAAVKAGADGIVATAPFYALTHRTEIERHFRILGERVAIPVLAYDLPMSVHSKLDGEMLLRLGQDGLLAGVKDSSGDDTGLRRLLLRRAEIGDALDHFAVLTGSETMVDAALAMGADGVVPGLGNVDPAGYVDLYRQYRAGDWAAARAAQERLLRLFDIFLAADRSRMGVNSAVLGAVKAALRLLGVIDDAVTAPPQTPLDDDEIARIAAILDAHGSSRPARP